jgi:hypothetical protein
LEKPKPKPKKKKKKPQLEKEMERTSDGESRECAKTSVQALSSLAGNVCM